MGGGGAHGEPAAFHAAASSTPHRGRAAHSRARGRRGRAAGESRDRLGSLLTPAGAQAHGARPQYDGPYCRGGAGCLCAVSPSRSRSSARPRPAPRPGAHSWRGWVPPAGGRRAPPGRGEFPLWQRRPEAPGTRRWRAGSRSAEVAGRWGQVAAAGRAPLSPWLSQRLPAPAGGLCRRAGTG